ncbi:hypothetical protein H6F90_15785 [Trichocoleus sp. FACHB-591]|uniref:hypothetical protein n=1 Tax=Trichocoleus sp. FACHB-591 TaxID=2692872 RepID=UPI001682173F|nr:hypothetical protein [Trichocoleus sp. FACHB-591]MBD2096594.1 hypothetical protein [Trichocoleus sp. FACHB-591]
MRVQVPPPPSKKVVTRGQAATAARANLAVSPNYEFKCSTFLQVNCKVAIALEEWAALPVILAAYRHSLVSFKP